MKLYKVLVHDNLNGRKMCCLNIAQSCICVCFICVVYQKETYISQCTAFRLRYGFLKTHFLNSINNSFEKEMDSPLYRSDYYIVTPKLYAENKYRLNLCLSNHFPLK